MLGWKVPSRALAVSGGWWAAGAKGGGRRWRRRKRGPKAGRRVGRVCLLGWRYQQIKWGMARRCALDGRSVSDVVRGHLAAAKRRGEAGELGCRNSERHVTCIFTCSSSQPTFIHRQIRSCSERFCVSAAFAGKRCVEFVIVKSIALDLLVSAYQPCSHLRLSVLEGVKCCLRLQLSADGRCSPSDISLRRTTSPISQDNLHINPTFFHFSYTL